VGLTPLKTLAPTWQALAAINAGFFNRNTRMPLGAIRDQDQWVSGPILHRGAFGWDGQGAMVFDRLSLQETLSTEAGEELPVLQLNSGYVQAGLARYTAAWGSTYTPLTDYELLIEVVGEQIIAHHMTEKAGLGEFAIPDGDFPNRGYLLVARAYKSVADRLPPGTTVRLRQQTDPVNFIDYPHILGAGPLLLKGGEIVLAPEAEKFSASFNRQAAIRSAIGQTDQGQLLWVTVQPQTGGRGPTLSQLALVMESLGAVDALNLDGGSSSSLYLGGALVNRSSRTAARIHNGLGLFWQESP
jgi:hypothetical protein